MFKNKHEFKAYAVSSYASTMLGQFVDNLVFALVFTVPAFGISFLPTLMFALTGAIVELICQVIFSPIGYKVANNWKEQGIGDEYLKELGLKNFETTYYLENNNMVTINYINSRNLHIVL